MDETTNERDACSVDALCYLYGPRRSHARATSIRVSRTRICAHRRRSNGISRAVRATEDLDLFIRATPENIEKLRSALRAAYEDDPHINEISSADLLGEYPAVRYVPRPAIYISM